MRWHGVTALFARARRPARVAHLQAIHAERLSTIHASAFARPWSSADFESFLAERAVRGDGVFLGRDAQPSGFVLTRMAADEAEILSVAVARNARNRGLARTLLAAHFSSLAHERVARVHLEVEEGNAPAIALYRSLDFREIGRREGYYVKPDGARASAITMMRRLDEP